MTDWLSPDAVPEQSELDKRDPRNSDDSDKKGKKYKTKGHRDVVEVGRSGGNREASSDSSVRNKRSENSCKVTMHRK